MAEGRRLLPRLRSGKHPRPAKLGIVRAGQFVIVAIMAQAVASHATLKHMHRLAHAYMILVAGAVGWGLLTRSKRRGVNFFTTAFPQMLLTLNGVRTNVPPHVGTGTRIVVMTEDGSYVERAKD